MEGAAGGLHKRTGVHAGRSLPGGVVKRGRLGRLLARARSSAPQEVWLPCRVRSAGDRFGVFGGVPAGMGSVLDRAALQALAGSWGRTQIFPTLHSESLVT
jgi:hypothetical protein